MIIYLASHFKEIKIKKSSTVKYDGYNKTKIKRIIRKKFRKNILKASKCLVIDFISFIIDLKGFNILMLVINRYFSFARKLFIKQNKSMDIITSFEYLLSTFKMQNNIIL